MPIQGYLSLVLHAHLPFVHHPEHDRFLEEDDLPDELLVEGLRRGTCAGRLVPVLCGSALRNIGVQPLLVDDEGKELEGNDVAGNLCIGASWPGQARTIWGDHERFVQTYFAMYPGRYFTGDGCRRDADGYYWITGRVDDVMNVSGHRISTAEVESALVDHEAVAEAAVVGATDDVTGQAIVGYVILVGSAEASDELRE